MITNDPSPFADEALADRPAFSEPHPPEIKRPVDGPVSNWAELARAFLAWAGSVAFLLLVPLLLVIPYFIYLALTSRPPTAEALGQDKTFILLSIIGVIPAHILTLFLSWGLVTRWGGGISFSKKLGLSWPPRVAPLQGFLVCSVIAMTLLGLGAIITYFLGGGKTDLDRLIESSFQARLATAFIAVFTAPLVEEVIYRGMLYPAIARVLGVAASVAIVSVMFAGVHVFQYKNNIGVIVVITVLSVTLTLIRAFTNRLLPSIVIHLVFNGLQSLYLVLEPFIDKTDKVPPAPALMHTCWLIRHLF